jgi:plastocyanin
MKPTAKLAVLGALVACGSAASLPSAHAGATTTVTLKNIAFHHPTVRIAKGSSVTWVWKDVVTPHNVTFARVHSGTKKTGTYTLRFTRAGTFNYHCTLHPGMDGKVIVR